MKWLRYQNLSTHALYFEDADAVWLGGSYTHHGEWQWINDNQIHRHDHHWHSYSETEDHTCLALVNDKWRSRSCSTEYRHLCETSG